MYVAAGEQHIRGCRQCPAGVFGQESPRLPELWRVVRAGPRDEQGDAGRMVAAGVLRAGRDIRAERHGRRAGGQRRDEHAVRQGGADGHDQRAHGDVQEDRRRRGRVRPGRGSGHVLPDRRWSGLQEGRLGSRSLCRHVRERRDGHERPGAGRRAALHGRLVKLRGAGGGGRAGARAGRRQRARDRRRRGHDRDRDARLARP